MPTQAAGAPPQPENVQCLTCSGSTIPAQRVHIKNTFLYLDVYTCIHVYLHTYICVCKDTYRDIEVKASLTNIWYGFSDPSHVPCPNILKLQYKRAVKLIRLVSGTYGPPSPNRSARDCSSHHAAALEFKPGDGSVYPATAAGLCY